MRTYHLDNNNLVDNDRKDDLVLDYETKKKDYKKLTLYNKKKFHKIKKSENIEKMKVLNYKLIEYRLISELGNLAVNLCELEDKNRHIKNLSCRKVINKKDIINRFQEQLKDEDDQKEDS